ncbi:MAG TPA: LysR substrate-binding domain-containing protein, partial [Paraburkholderia sp.]
LITLNADTGVRAALELAFNTNELKRRPLQELGHVAAVSRMVELGLGVGVLPVDAHWPAPGVALVSRPLVPEMSVTTLLVHRRNRSLRPNAAAAWAQFAAPAHHAGAQAPAAQSVTRAALARCRTVLHEP